MYISCTAAQEAKGGWQSPHIWRADRYGCWDINSGPLEEQQTLSVAQSSLQAPTEEVYLTLLEAEVLGQCGSRSYPLERVPRLAVASIFWFTGSLPGLSLVGATIGGGVRERDRSSQKAPLCIKLKIYSFVFILTKCLVCFGLFFSFILFI